MAALIRAFFHSSQNTADRAGVGTSFVAGEVHTHDLLDGAVPFMAGRAFLGRIESIVVQVKAISGGAKVTMRRCLDAGGDYPIIPDTEATIATGITTPARGAVAYSVGTVFQQTFPASLGNVYLFVKGDGGTFTLDSSTITWTES